MQKWFEKEIFKWPWQQLIYIAGVLSKRKENWLKEFTYNDASKKKNPQRIKTKKNPLL